MYDKKTALLNFSCFFYSVSGFFLLYLRVDWIAEDEHEYDSEDGHEEGGEGEPQVEEE